MYSSAHSDDERAEKILRSYLGAAGADKPVRLLKFEAGYRERQWIHNCVAVGLSAGFFEPLESTGLMLIEVAAAMIAEFFPWNAEFAAPARLYNESMRRRCGKIVNFLKMHYCLSGRTEPFWRDNRLPAGIPEELQCLLAAWRHRPPSHFDFVSDHETFPYFSYQYVLYGMGFRTDLDGSALALYDLQRPCRRGRRSRNYDISGNRRSPICPRIGRSSSASIARVLQSGRPPPRLAWPGSVVEAC